MTHEVHLYWFRALFGRYPLQLNNKVVYCNLIQCDYFYFHYYYYYCSTTVLQLLITEVITIYNTNTTTNTTYSN